MTYRLKVNIYDQIEFYIVDLRQKNKLNDLIQEYKPSYFAHLASQSSVKKSQDYKKLTEESNYLISKNIIESIENYSKDTIFSSLRLQTYMKGTKTKLLQNIHHLSHLLIMQFQNIKFKALFPKQKIYN